MVVYERPGKFFLVTEQRCGSSFLYNISNLHDSPLKPTTVNVNTVNKWLQEVIETNIPVYVLCRDIHHKRSSAVNMKTHGKTLRDQVNFLQGIISTFTHEKSPEVKSCNFYNFCLNDSHLDWGTSVNYHFLKSKGIKNLNLLWLQRPNLLEFNNDIQTLNNFLQFEGLTDCEAAQKYLSKHHNDLSKTYDAYKHFNSSNAGITPQENNHIILNESYNKIFRELTDHRDDVLKFSDWIWCEQFMNNTMIDQNKTCSLTSSEIINIVRQKMDILDQSEIKRLEATYGLTWWPGKRFMMLCSDMYNINS